MSRRSLYASLFLLGAATAPPARALLTFNDGKDKILVQGTYSFGYDSNIFTRKTATGSITEAYSVSATYTRHAGIIGVTVATSMSHDVFNEAPDQNFYDPNFSIGLTKGTGRTTGSLSLSAVRSDTPDPIANNRAIAWDYSSNLALRYPMTNGRYYITDSAGYALNKYLNNGLFANLTSYSEGAGMNYRYDSKLDVNASGEIGLSNTSDLKSTSYGFTLGSVGTILPKLSGTTNFGYNIRTDRYGGKLALLSKPTTYGSFYSSTSLTWRPTKTIGVTTDFDKSFSTASTDVTTGTTVADASVNLIILSKFTSSIGGSFTGTQFLGPLSQGRRDRLYEVFVNVGMAITTHIRTNLEWAYMVNYSTLSTGAFTRELITLSITATY